MDNLADESHETEAGLPMVSPMRLPRRIVNPACARGSDFEKPKLSIFTRTGLALLGRRVGDTIDGPLRIDALPYQPEAAGDFDL
jgi:hypothetical protein